MKKTRGKKKVSSSKKKKKFLFKRNMFVLGVIAVFTFVVIVASLLTVNNILTGSAITAISGYNVLDQPVSAKFLDATSWLDMGNTWKDVLVYIVVFAIIFVGLVDMMLLVSIFSNWVSWVIASGIAIIGALTGVVRQIALWMITIASAVGVIGIGLEIIIMAVIFIGLIFASRPIALFAAKRHALRAQVKEIKGAEKAASAIEGLKRIQEEFSKGQ